MFEGGDIQYEGGSDVEELKDEILEDEGAQSIKSKGKKKSKKKAKKSDTLKSKPTNVEAPGMEGD